MQRRHDADERPDRMLAAGCADAGGEGDVVGERHVEFAPCFKGSRANARYGLGWWLGVKNAPDDLFYASGAAGQAMYVVPSRKIVIVHFAKSSSYKHEAFLKLFFAPQD